MESKDFGGRKSFFDDSQGVESECVDSFESFAVLVFQGQVPLLGVGFEEVHVVSVLNPLEFLCLKHPVATDRNELAEVLAAQLLVVAFAHCPLDYGLEVGQSLRRLDLGDSSPGEHLGH